MSQVTDEIWVGSYAEACDEQFLKDRKINHILCCAEEFAVRAGFPYSDQRTGYKVSLKDDFADEKTMSLFLDGAAKLNEWISSGNRTMVHCFAGISRSVSVVITYFMIYKGWSFNTAFNHLKH
jgi:atypical dual specificity phosphatase